MPPLKIARTSFMSRFKNFKKDLRFLRQDKYGGKTPPRFFFDALRLALGEPLAYVIGWQPFLNLKIDLSYRPLIPRPETEFWVKEYVIDKHSKRCRVFPLKVLDIFAGSACLGLAFAKACPNSFVYVSDINESFIKQAKLNAHINSLSNVEFVQSDVFENINGGFDLILANPPYISYKDAESFVEASVLKYEDHTSLFADDNGLFFIKKLINETPDYLKPGGELFVEFGRGQEGELQKLAEVSKFGSFEILKDQYDRPRVLKLSL